MAFVAMLIAVGWTGAANAVAQTVVDTTDLALSPVFDVSEDFGGGPGVPTGWEGVPWAMGGAATVAGDVLTVDGARANTTGFFDVGRSMDFGATFTADPFQHVGFGVAFEDGPWAMFSTGGGSLAVGLYARTLTGPGGSAIDTPIVGVDPLVPHDYAIEWTPTEVRFYVDGALVATNAAAITVQMRPVASDFQVDGGSVDVEYLDLYRYPTSGTRTSRVFDAGDSRATWRTLTADVDEPPGTNVTFEARTGPTPSPSASWTAFRPVGPTGAVAGGVGHRYIQYRATLTTTDTSTTPFVDSVTLGYTVDTSAPATTIGGVTVSGRTARVTFSSEAGARFQCSLDNRAFQSCSSPRLYADLSPGRHTVRVRAIDQVGNVGPAATRSFIISGRPPDGDHKAPKVRPKPRSVKVSDKGRFRVRLRCPSDEKRCFIMLRIRYRGETIASKRVIVRGGNTAKVTLRLKRFARVLIVTRPRWKVFALTTARDPEGNRATTRTRMTLRTE